MSSSSSTKTCFSIGCSALAFFAVIGFLSFRGLGGFTPLLFLGAVGVIIAIIAKNNKGGSSISADMPTNIGQQSQSPYLAPVQSSVAPVAKEFETVICNHSFSAAELRGKETITCPCGYKFEVSMLKEYARLRKLVVSTQADLDATWRKLQLVKMQPKSTPTVKASDVIASRTEPRPVAARTTTAKTVAKPVVAPVTVSAPVAVVKPKPKRKSVSLSLQQWLIMGASVLIVIAGGIFVSVNVAQGQEPWFYLLVTLPLAFITGFMAFWGRKFSVMLANFMATFSSSMQLASFLVIATYMFPFAWDTAPAWWWGTDFLIVSAIAFVLARTKANLGWKVIALTGFTASALFFLFGVIREAFPEGSGSFGWFASISTAAAVILALESKAIRTFKFVIPKDSTDVEYEKDLAKREEAALERFSRFAAVALGVLAIGYTAYSSLAGLTSLEPLSFTIFSLVWIAAGAIQNLWIDGLASEQELQERINKWQHIIGFVSAAIALNAWIKEINNLWFGVLSTSILAFVAVIIGVKIKRIAAHPVAIRAAHIALPISWIAWYIPKSVDYRETMLALGMLMVLFALSLMLKHWFSFSSRTVLFATFTHIIGLGLLAGNIKTNIEFDQTSVMYSFLVLGMVLLGVLYSPLAALIAKKHKQERTGNWDNVVLVLSSLLMIALIIPNQTDSHAPEFINNILMLVISGVVVSLLAGVKKLALVKTLLQRYGYAFQTVVALLLVLTTRTSEDLAFTGFVLIGLSLMNYLLGWISKNAGTVQLAFGLGLAALALVSYEQLNVWTISSHLAFSIVGIGLLNTIQLLASKRTGAKYAPAVFFVSTFLFAVGSIAANAEGWFNADAELMVGLIELLVVAIVNAVVAEIKVKPRMAMMLRSNALVYLVVNHFTFAAIGDDQNIILKKMLISTVFAVIAFRQLVITSKGENKSTTRAWFLLSYVAPVMLAVLISNYLYRVMDVNGFSLDVFSAPLAVSLVIPTFFNRSILKGKRAFTALDLPVLITLGVQVLSGALRINTDFGVLRFTGALGLIAIFSYWRSMAEKNVRWVYLGFITGGIGGVGLGRVAHIFLLSNSEVIPEIYTVLVALSILVGSHFLIKRVELAKNVKQLIMLDVPVLLPVVVSIGYALSQDLTSVATLTRLFVSALLFTGYAHFKLAKLKLKPWAVATYVGLIGTMVSLVQLLNAVNSSLSSVPELYSVAIAVAVLLGNMELKRVIKFKTSLISLGLPLAALLIPSILYSYNSIALPFEQIGQIDVVRVIGVLVIALVATVLGVRQGSLGATVVGGVSLALVVIPVTWFRAGDAENSETTISLRSLVIGAILFGLFAILRRADRVPNNSYIYIGIPTVVALAPSLFLTIAALNNPTLTNVDWYRFGIIIVVSLTLLIVGALRSLGGMFFPGLIGVLVGVLPYAFKPIAAQSWFLWVILLLIAGIMVWIAVRLEQLRKLGKSSVSWVKTLH